MMAENLIKLGLHLDKDSYKQQALDIVNQVSDLITQETSYLSQWASVSTLLIKPIPEIVIVGHDFEAMAAKVNALNIPHKVIAAAEKESDLPLLSFKTEINDQTAIYICFNKTCKLPVTDLDEALAQIPN